MNAYLGEFVGTLLLILLGNGVVANVSLPQTKGHGAGWLAITLGWGMAVFVAVWCVKDASGAHINPAVTIGLAVAGEFSWGLTPGYIAAQMAGAFIGAGLVWVTYRDHYRLCQEADAIRGTFCNTPAVRNYPRNVLSEAIATCVLVLAVLVAAQDAPGEKIGLGVLGALPTGLLVLSIGISLGGCTGYAINPARDLSPRIAHAVLPIAAKGPSDWAYSWVPVAGPLLGGVAAALAFGFLW